MIVEYIRYVLTTHSAEEVIAGYRDAAVHLQAAPECLSYEVTQCAEEASSVIVRILWQSTDAHLNGFRKGPNFPPFLAAILPFIPEIAEMRHYEFTDVNWQRD